MVSSQLVNLLCSGLLQTLYMVIVSTLFAYLFGLPYGILLSISRENGLKPRKKLYWLLDLIVNIGRSIPFLILLILLIPFTRMVAGKSYGTTATIVPLTIAAIPFVARMVESSLNEVDQGVIEAGQAMGASVLEIIFRIIIPEARASLLSGACIALGTIISYSAMAGAVGGGGLGDISIRYGYYRYETGIMIVTVVIIVLLAQLIQIGGNYLIKKVDHR